MWSLVIIGFGFALSIPQKDYAVCIANRTLILQSEEGVRAYCIPDREALLQLRSIPR